MLNRLFPVVVRRDSRPSRGFAAFLLATILILLISPLPAAAFESTISDGLIILHPLQMQTVYDFIDEYSDRGAWLPHVYPSGIIIGQVPEELERMIRNDKRVAEFHRRPVSTARLKTATQSELDIIGSFNHEGESSSFSPPVDKSWLESSAGCKVFYSEEHSSDGSAKQTADSSRVYGRASGASILQTSEWLMGRNAVGIVLPNRPGTVHATQDRQRIHEEVRAAFGFLASQMGSYPRTIFIYDFQNDIETLRNFRTTPPHLDQAEWVNELMGNMGYDWETKETPFGPVYEYMDSLRTRLEAEWAVTIFLPNVDQFTGTNYAAFAHLGGPFLVAPAGSDGRVGNLTLSGLLIHEAAHLYYALDEYPPGGTSSPCRAVSGYLAVQNRNSQNRDWVCAQRRTRCAMASPADALCEYTRAMLGWADEDDDGIPDVLDTYPFIRQHTGRGVLPDTITTTFPEIHVRVEEVPLPNRVIGSATNTRRHSITFNRIEHIIFKIDDGNWFFADPEGGWPELSKSLEHTFVPESLPGGQHRITLRAVNDAGNESFDRFEEQFDLFVKAIAIHGFDVQPDFDGDIRISFKVFGGAFGSQATLYREDLEGNAEVVDQFRLVDNRAYELYDHQARPGERFTYRLVVRGLGLEWDWSSELEAPSPIKRGEFLSTITPNPFRHQTVISYRVPRGEPAERSGGGGKPGSDGGDRPDNLPPPTDGAPQGVLATRAAFKEVRVELDVFNIAGRRVRHFAPFHALEGIRTDPITWYGKNDAGEDLPQGVYFIRLRGGNEVLETRKVVLIR